jgi:RNA polymerase sigma-70 factor (ECF subfamily)
LDALYRTALGLTGETSSAEDLVQETLLRAFRAYPTFERGTNFRAWIFRILTNAHINEYHRKGRAPLLSDFAEAEPAAEDESPYLSVDDVERLGDQLGDSAKRALEKVPPEFRVPFLLSTFEKLRYKEIAEVLGIPLGTVMSRLFRARKILRQELTAFARRKGFLKGKIGP